MMYNIEEAKFTDEVEQQIIDSLVEHELVATGVNISAEPTVFEMREDGKRIACVVVQLFRGQLYIKYLFVAKPYRGRGLSKILMDKALEFGKGNGCTFAFLETFNYQAPGLYKKMGFKVDFVREGYKGDASFYYFSKEIK